MILTFKRTGCDMIRISDPTGAEVESYLKTAIFCSTITKDLECIQIINNVKSENIIGGAHDTDRS